MSKRLLFKFIIFIHIDLNNRNLQRCDIILNYFYIILEYKALNTSLLNFKLLEPLFTRGSLENIIKNEEAVLFRPRHIHTSFQVYNIWPKISLGWITTI